MTDFEDAPQKLLVEALGTFALCFMGIGAIILTQGQDIVAIALAHGLAIGLMVTAAGHISGGHFNPAVTIGALVTGKIAPGPALAYIIAQLVGAAVGAAALTLTFLDVDRNRVDLGLPAIGQSIAADPVVSLSASNALVMEAILTFFLMFVIFGVAMDNRTGGRAVAGLAIGLTITMDILAGGVVSGAAMNPARWFGPAIVQQEFGDFWIWIVGPVAGAVVAALVYNVFLMGNGTAIAAASDGDRSVADSAGEQVAKASASRSRKRRR
ncbi:MAG: aquaporin [Thermomicrobiales bacterium]|jgi:aquaporin Z|nr:aquaporin [Thermomicrobiales bacterium]